MNNRNVEILLVDDNPNDVELALHAFKRANLSNPVHVARDGAEALDFLFATGAYAGRNVRNGPKVVLLDLKLPKLNGVEVLRQIRTNPDTKTLPVVALTSSHEDRDLRDCYEFGVNSYIVKPVDFEQFTEAVRQIGSYWLVLNQAPAPAPAPAVAACV